MGGDTNAILLAFPQILVNTAACYRQAGGLPTNVENRWLPLLSARPSHEQGRSHLPPGTGQIRDSIMQNVIIGFQCPPEGAAGQRWDAAVMRFLGNRKPVPKTSKQPTSSPFSSLLLRCHVALTSRLNRLDRQDAPCGRSLLNATSKAKLRI